MGRGNCNPISDILGCYCMDLFAGVDRFLEMGWNLFDAFVKYYRTDVTCASLGKWRPGKIFTTKCI